MAPGAAEAKTSGCWGIDAKAAPATGSVEGKVGNKGDETGLLRETLRAGAVSVGPADVAMSRLAGVGSVTSRRLSPYEVLCGRLLIVGRIGAELTRWVARRESLGPGTATVRSFLDERKEVMEKERLGLGAFSGCDVEGRPRVWFVTLVANVAAMLSGVSGRLTKKTLSASSLVESSISSTPATTDLASTSIGLCFSSGNILLNPFAYATEPRRLASVRSLVILAVKNCVYSTSLSVLAEVCCSSVEVCSAVMDRRAP